MSKSYHIISIPLYDWKRYIPENISQLAFLMKSTEKLFGFNFKRGLNWENRKLTSKKYEKLGINAPILFSGLTLLKHEISWVWEITDLLEKYCGDEVKTLKISKAYVSHYAIEIVSKEKDLFFKNNEYVFQEIARKLSHILFDGVNIEEIENGEFGVITSVGLINLIICQKEKEVKEISKKIKKIDIESDKFVIFGANSFNFIKKPWSDHFLGNSIVMLEPNHFIFDQKSNEVVGPYISFIIAVSKLYVISESIYGLSANLTYKSWYMDELFLSFEKSFYYLKRNFLNLERILYKELRSVKQPVQHLKLFYSSPLDFQNLEREYGGELFPAMSQSLGTISHFLCSDYLKVNSDEFRKTVFNDLKVLSERISKFIDNFQNAAKSWRELHQGKLNHNLLLLAIITLIASIVSIMISVIIK